MTIPTGLQGMSAAKPQARYRGLEECSSMTEDEIPEFVKEVIATGCDMCAIETWGYVFGDADLAPEDRKRISNEIARIADTYGKRDHLKFEINSYLRSIGRVLALKIH